MFIVKSAARAALLGLTLIACGCASEKGAITSTLVKANDPPKTSGMRYFLPMGRLKMQVTAGYLYAPADAKRKLNPELVLAALEPSIVGIVPGTDRNAAYHLALNPSVFSDDHFCILVSSSGLLETIGIVTADRSADVIQKVAETAATFFTGVPEIAIAKGPKVDRSRPWKWVFDAAPFADVVFNPDDEDEVGGAQSTIRRELGRRREAVNLNPSAALKIMSEPIEATEVRFWVEEKIAVALQNDKTVISLEGGVPQEAATAPPGPAAGVYYRTPSQRLFTVAPDHDIAGKMQSYLGSLPDPTSTAWIDVTRATLVRKGTNLALSGGMLTKVDVNKPSEALAAVSLPLNVAGAVIETPARFFTAITKSLKSETALINAKADLIKAEAELEKIKKGQAGDPPDGASAGADQTKIASATTDPASFNSSLTCQPPGQ